MYIVFFIEIQDFGLVQRRAVNFFVHCNGRRKAPASHRGLVINILHRNAMHAIWRRAGGKTERMTVRHGRRASSCVMRRNSRGVRSHRGYVAVAGNTGKAVSGVSGVNVNVVLVVVLGAALDAMASGHITYRMKENMSR